MDVIMSMALATAIPEIVQTAPHIAGMKKGSYSENWDPIRPDVLTIRI